MKKYFKAGLLIVTLVIPALIFTFLRFFATNHYNIPYYFPLKDSNGKVVISKNDTVFYKVQELNVETLNKNNFPQHPFQGKLTVVHSQSGKCEDDSCQLVLSNLERIYNLRDKIKSLNILTICDSISNAVIQTPAFISKDGWIVSKVTPDEYKNVFDKTLKFQTLVPGAKINSVKSKLMLIDNNEHIRGYYNGSDPEEINRLMAEIKILNLENGLGSRK